MGGGRTSAIQPWKGCHDDHDGCPFQGLIHLKMSVSQYHHAAHDHRDDCSVYWVICEAKYCMGPEEGTLV